MKLGEVFEDLVLGGAVREGVLGWAEVAFGDDAVGLSVEVVGGEFLDIFFKNLELGGGFVVVFEPFAVGFGGVDHVGVVVAADGVESHEVGFDEVCAGA